MTFRGLFGNLGAVVIVAFLAAGLFIVYRIWDASNNPYERWLQGSSLWSISCKTQYSDFSHSGVVHVFFDDKQMYFVDAGVSEGEKFLVEAVGTAERVYAWRADDIQGGIIADGSNFAKGLLGQGVDLATLECRPLWRSNEQAFKVPDFVHFDDLTQAAE